MTKKSKNLHETNDEQLAGDFTQTSNYFNNIDFISIL